MKICLKSITIFKNTFRSFLLSQRLEHHCSKWRNVGIIAHIDAGKTTTTERILFNAGVTSSLGNIDDGTTVTDFMEQERERGITISSAVVHFNWKDHRVSLIDTPGHIDFTSEVECCLKVLDGAILVLDASAGVEAQTLQVWRQSKKEKMSNLIFLNKMDKRGASLETCLVSIETKLKMEPLLLQRPLFGKDGVFEGIVDLVTMERCLWIKNEKGESLKRKEEGDAKSEKLRERMISQLVEKDEELESLFLSSTSLQPHQINSAIRRVTLSNKLLPVLCGSSLRNKGVRELVDALVQFLPDASHNLLPLSYPSLFAFKVTHNNKHQPITFLKLLSGSLHPPTSLIHLPSGEKEKFEKLFQIQADSLEPVSLIQSGMIIAAPGLKMTKTGHILTSKKPSDPLPLLPHIKIPNPVFFCSIEAPTLSSQKNLDQALDCLAREDPSLKVKVEPLTGQTVLGGMGKLHLEVIRDRIFQEFKIDASLGPMHVAYLETMATDKRDVMVTLEKMLSGSKNKVYIKMTFERNEEKVMESEGKLELRVEAERDSELSKKGLREDHKRAVERGLEQALSRGPLMGCPIRGVKVILREFKVNSGKISHAIISSCASQGVQKAICKKWSSLLQPIMSLQLITPEDFLSTVLSELTRRHGVIENINREGRTCSVEVLAPLAELEDLASDLRGKTRGMTSLSMHLSFYQEVGGSQLQGLLQGSFL